MVIALDLYSFVSTLWCDRYDFLNWVLLNAEIGIFSPVVLSHIPGFLLFAALLILGCLQSKPEGIESSSQPMYVEEVISDRAYFWIALSYKYFGLTFCLPFLVSRFFCCCFFWPNFSHLSYTVFLVLRL